VTEGTKILVDAGSTVILAITLLVAVYYLTKSQGAKSSAAEHDSNATQMTAKSNLLLAEALDRFSEAAKLQSVLAKEQEAAVARNLTILESSKSGINHIATAVDEHALSEDARDKASIKRDAVTTQAIEALPGKIQLVMQADSNELMLQIQVALKDFMSRLNPPGTQSESSDVIIEVKAERAPESGESISEAIPKEA